MTTSKHTSYVVVKIARGLAVGFLHVSRQNVATWKKTRDGCYRFTTESEAHYFLSTLPECVARVVEDSRPPSSRTYPKQPRGKPTPPPTPALTLEPITFSAGEKLGLAIAACVAVLFAVALVMGW